MEHLRSFHVYSVAGSKVGVRFRVRWLDDQHGAGMSLGRCQQQGGLAMIVFGIKVR